MSSSQRSIYVLPINLFILVLFVLVLFLVLVSNSTEIKEYYPAERDGLIRFRESVDSRFLDLHSNWTGPPCVDTTSRWIGIECLNGHVVGLELEGFDLTGSFPSDCLNNVTFLTKLGLRNNSIFGSLPSLNNLARLESVLLSGNRFSGGIPFEYTGLRILKRLELEENDIDGKIPPFDQPDLMVFNVSYNRLDGRIPETDILQRFPRSSYEHNDGLCGDPLEKQCPVSPPPMSTPPPSPVPLPPPPDKSKKKKNHRVRNIALIAAAAAGIPTLVILVFLCYCRKVQRKEDGKDKQTGSGSPILVTNKPSTSRDPERTVSLQFFDKNLPIFDLDDLLRASAEMLGNGVLGSTYKATVESGHVVTTKRLKNMNSVSKKEFVHQMQLLGKMKHENVARIVSFYYSKEEKLVIYEFVPNGSLFDLLHGNRGIGRVPLSWTIRLSIIKEAAKGLTFLHQSLPSHKVPHANLKSTNILIHRENEQYRCKLTDYGYLPLLPDRKSIEKLSIGRSPEFCQGKKVTRKTDVYCFGIVLLEVITGKIPGEKSDGNEDRDDDLSDWVRMVVNNDWSTDILDLELLAVREGQDKMLKLTELALECSNSILDPMPKLVSFFYFHDFSSL